MPAQWIPDAIPQELVDLTRSLGEPSRDLVILAEGNTSQRLDSERIAVKMSGSNMATATAEDFVVVDVAEILAIVDKQGATQVELTSALDAGEVGGRRRRGSIETIIHVAVQAVGQAEFVGHTHPTDVVGLLASVHAATAWDYFVYSDEAVVVGTPLYVPYAQPGISLGRLFLRELRAYADREGSLPQLVLLGNHGIVAIAPTAAGVEAVSSMAVKGARVRASAYAAGGVAPLPSGSVDSFFARDDIRERRANLTQGK